MSTIPSIDGLHIRDRVFWAAVALHAANKDVSKTQVAKALGIKKQNLTKIEDFDTISKAADALASSLIEGRPKSEIDDLKNSLETVNRKLGEERNTVRRQEEELRLLQTYVAHLHDFSDSERLDVAISQGAKKTSKQERILSSVPDLPTKKEEDLK